MSSSQTNTTAISHNRLGQAVTGAIAGVLIGFIIEPFCFWDAPPALGTIRLPIIGPTCGAVIGSLFGFIAGGVRLRGSAKHVIVGAIVGIFAGLLVGAFPFPIIYSNIDPRGGGLGGGKIFAAAQRAGIVFGIAIGAVLGIVAGLVYSLRTRNGKNPAA